MQRDDSSLTEACSSSPSAPNAAARSSERKKEFCSSSRPRALGEGGFRLQPLAHTEQGLGASVAILL